MINKIFFLNGKARSMIRMDKTRKAQDESSPVKKKIVGENETKM